MQTPGPRTDTRTANAPSMPDTMRAVGVMAAPFLALSLMLAMNAVPADLMPAMVESFGTMLAAR